MALTASQTWSKSVMAIPFPFLGRLARPLLPKKAVSRYRYPEQSSARLPHCTEFGKPFFHVVIVLKDTEVFEHSLFGSRLVALFRRFRNPGEKPLFQNRQQFFNGRKFKQPRRRKSPQFTVEVTPIAQPFLEGRLEQAPFTANLL